MTTLLPDSVCQHNTRVVLLNYRGYDTEGEIMEEIPAGRCSYVHMVDDFSFGRSPEGEQLLVILCHEDSAHGGIG